jgi:hypothetical protein
MREDLESLKMTFGDAVREDETGQMVIHPTISDFSSFI